MKAEKNQLPHEGRVSPLLSIITVNYHSETDLETCVNSLKRYPPDMEYHLVVIDNGSSGNDLKRMLGRIDLGAEMQVIRNGENVGFARACNQGMRLSRGEFILLLNPDTLFVENSIRSMMDFLKQHPDVGAVGCKQALPSGRHYVGDAGYHPSLGRAFNHSFFLSRFFPKLLKGIYIIRDFNGKRAIQVDWVSGGCMLFRKEVFQQVGGLDESFFLYSEDVEWCARIKRHGWQIFYLPFTHIVHHRRRESGDRNLSLWRRSQIHLYHRDHHGVSTRFFSMTILSGLILRSILYFFLYSLSRNSEDKRRAEDLLQSVFGHFESEG